MLRFILRVLNVAQMGFKSSWLLFSALHIVAGDFKKLAKLYGVFVAATERRERVNATNMVSKMLKKKDICEFPSFICQNKAKIWLSRSQGVDRNRKDTVDVLPDSRMSLINNQNSVQEVSTSVRAKGKLLKIFSMNRRFQSLTIKRRWAACLTGR